ncbi:MAG: prepilin-type N-terminal cleavage/methylation domain-containing protein [Candidatus Omnitrophica bacterium]|nr:prepilin-type N-terminal cleavage/methylation domain-containing protein [Candidatus Omnitrophota bacterium]
MFKRAKNTNAFSLIELMIASAILMFIMIGMLSTYIACFELNEFTRNLTLTNNALQAKMETLRETPFDSLLSLDGTNFSLNGFSASNAKGVIDVYSTAYSDLIYVRLVACWKQKAGRVIGEDKNLNGRLDLGEDDGDGVLESPAEIVSFISRAE